MCFPALDKLNACCNSVSRLSLLDLLFGQFNNPTVLTLRHILIYRYIYYITFLQTNQSVGKCTLARDEIQGRLAALDDMHRTSRGDDIPSLRLG